MWDNPTFEIKNLPCDLTFRYPIHTPPLNWIIENQLGRRNLNPNQIAYLRGKRYECEKKIVSNEKGVNQYSKEVDSTIRNQPDSNTVEKPLTRDRVAKEYGVSGSTISDNLAFSNVVDMLPDKSKNDVLSGKDKIPRDDARVILKMPKPIQKQFIKEVEKGTPIK